MQKFLPGPQTIRLMLFMKKRRVNTVEVRSENRDLVIFWIDGRYRSGRIQDRILYSTGYIVRSVQELKQDFDKKKRKFRLFAEDIYYELLFEPLTLNPETEKLKDNLFFYCYKWYVPLIGFLPANIPFIGSYLLTGGFTIHMLFLHLLLIGVLLISYAAGVLLQWRIYDSF